MSTNSLVRINKHIFFIKQEDYENININIGVLGAYETGKTNIIYRFLNYNNIIDDHDKKFEHLFNTSIKIDSKDYCITIQEIDNVEDYDNLDNDYLNQRISNSEGLLLIFSINDKNSFEFIKKMRDKILKEKNKKKYPLILVGNKQDLMHERKVEYSEAKALADSWKIEYIETSAHINYNIKEAFNILVKEIIKFKSNQKKKDKKCVII